MLPDHTGNPEAWNAIVTSAYGPSDDEFRRRVHSRMPLVIKRDLDEQSAELMCASLRALGATVAVFIDDGQNVYLQRNAQTLGPLPMGSLGHFAQDGDQYRLQEDVEWHRWTDDLGKAASPVSDLYDTQVPFITAPDATATPPWLDAPPPVPGYATPASSPPDPFSPSSNVAPPPFLLQPPPVTHTSTLQPAQRMDGVQQPKRWGGVAILIGVVVVVGLMALGLSSYRNSTTPTASASPAVANQSPPPATTSPSALPQKAVAPLTAAAPVATSASSTAGAGSPAAGASVTNPVTTPASFTVPHMSSVKPSFDCTQAQTPTELAICSNDDLSRLDSEMAQTYRHTMATQPSDQVASIRASQRQWVEQRAAQCGADGACIQSSLQSRINELDQLKQDAQNASGAEEGKLEAANACYSNANYDCSIQIAQSLLTQNPADTRAQDLMARSKQAQEQALHGNWNVH